MVANTPASASKSPVTSATACRWLPRAALLVLYVLYPTVFTGCSRPSGPLASGSPLPPGALVAVIGASESDPAWPGIRGGAKRYDEQSPNLECLLAAPDRDDPESLRAVVNDVSAKHPLAICLCVADPEKARPVAREIVTRGLLLVTIGKPLDAVGAYGSVEIGWPEAAETLGRSLDAIAHGRRSYVLLHENGNDALASQCYARFSVAAQRDSMLKLLTVRHAAGAPGGQQHLVREMLGVFPHAGLIVTLSPEPWLAVQPRLELPRRTQPGETVAYENRFVTLGAAPRLWPRLKSGEAAALAGPLDGEVGYAAVELAVRGLMHIPSAMTRRVISCELVTPETLGDFAQRYAAAAGLTLADLMPFESHTPASQPGGG